MHASQRIGGDHFFFDSRQPLRDGVRSSLTTSLRTIRRERFKIETDRTAFIMANGHRPPLSTIDLYSE
jgi:hypothetical protein